MNIFKRILKGNEYKIISKNLGHGYIYEEMVLIEKFAIFIRNAKTNFNPSIDNYLEHPDWKKFSKVVKQLLEYHKKKTSYNNFKMIIDADKDFFIGIWESFSEEEKNKIKALADRLDNDKIFKKSSK